MNPMIHFMKTHGLKVCLPLLLLTTACGEGTSSSSFQASDAESEPVAELSNPAPASRTAAPSPAPVAPPAAGVDIDLGVEEKPVLPVAISPVEPTKVPEPAAIAGLAITALGLVAVKRKRVAAA